MKVNVNPQIVMNALAHESDISCIIRILAVKLAFIFCILKRFSSFSVEQ